MKLSEKLHMYTQDPDPRGVHINMADLILDVKNLESENQELKARLQGISQRAEDLQQAAIDMETVLNKFRTGG